MSYAHVLVQPTCRVYVHCTAGLGRAPGVCIAYIHWFGEQAYTLDAAYKHLTEIRPCGPKRDAVRGATFDLMSGQSFDAFERQPSDGFAALDAADRYALQYRVLK
jgi:protein-tyrosine phosphatase